MARPVSLRPHHPGRRPRGAALVLALFLVTLLLMLAMGYLQTAITETLMAGDAADVARAFYAAEAGIESAFQQLRALVADGGGVVTDDQLGTIVAPTLSAPSLSTRFNIALTVERGNPAGAPTYTTTLDSGPFRDLRATVQDYLLTSTATYAARNVRTTLSQVVQYGRIPLFQFGIFYGRGVDLEIFPGPSMTFTGRVHANSNIYLRGPDTGNTLKFDSYMTAAGNIYRSYKTNPSQRTLGGGTVQVKDAGGTYRELNFDHDASVGFSGTWTAEQWKTQALSTFNGKVLDSAMGVPEIVPPVPGLFYNPSNPDVVAHRMIERGTSGDSAAMKNAKMYYQAGLLILDGQPKVLDSGGNPVNTAWTLSSCEPGTVSPESFYDARQQKTMQVTQVDIGKLNACNRMPANGILYVSLTQTANDDRGVRLVNGATLPAGGLTVVSDNPLYVKGDYNSNGKKPAAILADAVTMLSNNWDDSNSSLGLYSRIGTETTVNAAIATGPNRESVAGDETAGASGGGVHNVIRFLEDWHTQGTGDYSLTPARLNFAGAIVALWHSQHAQGAFRSGPMCAVDSCAYYNPPVRNWSSDESLNTSQPPGAPYAMLMIRRQWLKL